MATIADVIPDYQFVREIATGIQLPIYQDYFEENSVDWTIRTRAAVDRDAMARRLMKSTEPVVFSIMFSIIDRNFLMIDNVTCVHLTLTVIDIDNNSPRFPVTQLPYIIRVDEGIINARKALPKAIDADEGVNSTTNYTLVDGLGIFRLELRYDQRGTISEVLILNNVALDAEQRVSYNLTVIASEGNDNPDSDSLPVMVVPNPICDENPYFPTSRYYVSVEEQSPSGTVVFSNLTAIDHDIGDDTLSYDIVQVIQVDATDREVALVHPFMLDQESGILTLNSEIDREVYLRYEVDVQVVDSCDRYGTATVVVELEDINDNTPTVACSPCLGRTGMSEDNTPVTVDFLLIDDRDTGPNGNVSVQVFENVTGMLVPSTNFYLEINPDEDRSQLKRNITFDYERQQVYHVVLNASDHGIPERRSVLFFTTIIVEDFNDNPPILDPIDPVYLIDENPLQDSEILQLSANDLDSVAEGNGVVSFSLPENHGVFQYQHLFRIEENTGRLLVAGTLDREQQEFLSVLVNVTDTPAINRPLSATVVVNITLGDLNDYTPNITFPIGSITISEEHTPNTVAFTVTAVDLDTPPFSNITYSFVSNSAPFRINPTSGEVTLLSPLDFETTESYTLRIRASDGTLDSMREVTVMVGDENDEAPVFEANPSMPAVLEGQTPEVLVANISATDLDTPQVDLVFSIGSGNELGHFRIDPNTGQIYTVTMLDKESIDFYNLTIRVFDGRQFAVEDELVIVAVSDINDHIPEFIGEPFQFSVPEGMPINSPVDTVVARDRDTGRNAVIRFSILEVIPSFAFSWFSINSMSGEITTSQVLDREFQPPPSVRYNGFVTVKVAARDNSSQLQNETYVRISISDVNDEGPTFSVPSVSLTVPENTATGLPFSRVEAVDRDQHPNNQIVYSITNRFPQNITERIRIDDRGQLILITPLDYETEPRVDFVVRAHDRQFRDRFDDLSVSINVTDSQECDLKFVGLPTLTNVTEESPPDTTIATFEATDAQGHSIPLPGVQYTTTILTGEPSVYFGVSIMRSSTQANLHTLVGGRDLDRETLANQPSGTSLQVNVTASIMEACTLTSVVTVTIVDRNDNAPAFSNSSYQFSILENNNIGSTVGRVSANDPDLDDNGVVDYFIQDAVPFAINDRGMITALSSLDHDGSSQTYEFRVIARDRGTPSMMSSSAVVQVIVQDENDNPPVFSPTQDRTFMVGEETPINTVIAHIIVTDDDSGTYGTVTLTSLHLDSHFTLISNGSLVLAQTLDRETRHKYSFVARAEDGGGQVAIEPVNIVVTDFNDHAPVFRDTIRTSISIFENRTNDEIIETVNATDDDIGINAVIRYTLADRTYAKTFEIDQQTGDIRVKTLEPSCLEDTFSEVIDFERQNRYDLTVLAYDLGSPRHIVNKTIEITILNVNEHRPLFNTGTVTVYANETQLSGVPVARIRAYDMDNDPLNYEVRDFENDQPSTFFRYDNGAIVTTQPLDYRSRRGFALILRVSEVSGEHTGLVEVNVMVNNINNHHPIFDSIDPVRIPETTAVGTVIATVHASDADNNTHDALSYRIDRGNDQGLFTIDPMTGEIWISNTLDFDRQQEHELVIQAEDSGPGHLLATDPLNVRITLIDENDESPIFTQTTYTFSLDEYSPAGTVVGRVDAPDHDSDRRYFGAVRYFISGSSGVSVGNDYFTINANNGDVVSLVAVDRNEFLAQHSNQDFVSFDVVASDGGSPSRSATATVVVQIADINNHKPVFSRDRYLVPISPSQPANVSLPQLTLEVTDADAGANAQFNLTLTTSELPVQISGDGRLSLLQPLPQDYRTSYRVVVQATDSQNSSKYSQAEVLLLVETDTNHHPVFDEPEGKYTVPLREDAQPGSSVFNTREHVTDNDEGSGSQISYAFAPGQDHPNFVVSRSTGVITLQQSVDYESSIKSYILEVVATDGSGRASSAFINVSVTPFNEFDPIPMPGFPQQITLSPVDYIGVELFDFTAEDPDEGDDGVVRYSLDNEEHLLEVDQVTGTVKNRGRLTIGTSLTATITAYDLGSLLRSSIVTVLITIEDAGASVPVFSAGALASQTIRRAEEPIVSVPLGTFRAEGAQSHHIVRQNGSAGMFSIIEDAGQVTIQKELDYETATQYQLVIEARSETRTDTHLTRRSAYLLVDVIVEDRNDLDPVFDPIDRALTVPEDTRVGESIGQVHASDGDSGTNGEVQYEIFRSASYPFSINSTSGVISVASSLDREEVSFYDLRIRAFDLSDTNKRLTEMLLHIDIRDVNDSPLRYEQENYTIDVFEYPHTKPGENIIKMAATDLDLGSNSSLRYGPAVPLQAYHFTNLVQQDSNAFTIHFDTGMVSVENNIELNYDVANRYIFRIRSHHVNDETSEAFATLTINILDVNNHKPNLRVPTEIRTFEGLPAGTRVTEDNAISATDADHGINGWVTYSLGDGWPQDHFAIDQYTGVIRINRPIVYSPTVRSFNATIVATDHGVPPRRDTKMLYIYVIDINHAPVFDSSSYVIQISAQPENRTLYNFTVRDEFDDFLGVNNGFPFVQIPRYYDDANEVFQVTMNADSTIFNASLVLKERITTVEVRNYTFRFEAFNHMPSPECPLAHATSYADVTVIVHPANLHCPVFEANYAVQVSEGMSYPDPITRVSATDLEENGIRYSIYNFSDDSPFEINAESGDIILNRVLDREEKEHYMLRVLASDDGFPSRTCSNGTIVSITVLDVNDNVPMFEHPQYSESIHENVNPQLSVVVATVKANDPDLGEAGKVVYQMTSSVGLPFKIDNGTGQITATESLDYETSHQYSFAVYAFNPDRVDRRGTAMVQVNVIDVNEHKPVFVDKPTGPVYVEPGLSKGDVVLTVRASDGDGGPEGRLTYNFTNEPPRVYFIINSSMGVITFKGIEDIPTNGRDSGDANVVVKRQAESVNNYFLVPAIVQAVDRGGKNESIEVQFQVHNSYGNVPTSSDAAPLGLLIGVVAGVVLAVVVVFLIIFVCAFVCKRRRIGVGHIKTAQIKEIPIPMNNMDVGRFSRQVSSQRSGSSRGSSRYQTGIRGIYPEHSRISAGSSGSNSNRGSYTADDEMESMAGENGVYAHSLPRKSPSPTSDLASTVATEMLGGPSQEHPPYSKAQMAAIYAANQDILVTGSQNSIHMFGSEGGGEGDGDMDIDTMLFTKLNDFEDDDDEDDDDDDDDDDDTTLPDDTSYREHQSISGSGGNLTIPRPVEEREDPFPYSPSQPKWAPQIKPMEDAIEDLHELAAYPSTDHDDPPAMHHSRMPYMYEHHSQGTPVYEPSAHDNIMMSRHPMHRYHDQRPPPPASRMPADYGHGIYGTPPQEARHPMRHMVPSGRPPRQKRYGSAAELTLHYPHDVPPPPRFSHGQGGGFSQEMPPYHHLPSHYVPQLNTHTPSSSTATPTEEGTVTPNTALTGEYMDQSYNFSSSSTSLSTGSQRY